MRLICAAALALGVLAGRTEAPKAVLTSIAVLPAETMAAGPPSGAFLPDGRRANAPPFPGQPVQGFSSIRPDHGGWFWALSDNGYGTKANSPDFLLRIYRVRPVFGEKRVDVDRRFVQGWTSWTSTTAGAWVRRTAASHSPS